MAVTGRPGQHGAGDVRVGQPGEGGPQVGAGGVLGDLLLDQRQRVTHVRIDAGTVGRQGREVVVVDHVHELELRPERLGQPRGGMGGQQGRLGRVEGTQDLGHTRPRCSHAGGAHGGGVESGATAYRTPWSPEPIAHTMQA